MAPAIFFGSSFFFHLLWESLQAPLYAGYTSFAQHFPICLKAAVGDMFFMLVVYLALALIHRNFFWAAQRSSYAHPMTWVLPLFIGIFFAISFEWWAVYAAHRWAYGAMPLIPILHVGVTPVLQMIVVPTITLILSARFTIQ